MSGEAHQVMQSGLTVLLQGWTEDLDVPPASQRALISKEQRARLEQAVRAALLENRSGLSAARTKARQGLLVCFLFPMLGAWLMLLVIPWLIARALLFFLYQSAAELPSILRLVYEHPFWIMFIIFAMYALYAIYSFGRWMKEFTQSEHSDIIDGMVSEWMRRLEVSAWDASTRTGADPFREGASVCWVRAGLTIGTFS
jgi:hypothetical protein